ncbi:HalOD1 output domain-containing protein [Natrinema salsiterrestre]|uniref:Halobacterial output domain-containing protein n=1 Tax=Natrinema salsiterrestre TaxID=2950540 RepID=A0A9Q4Q079_9EURY|nr:HalOD1 output domain-containing protein [Natrinema salsiterrestre]MDF9745514.1 hypothetical protein [Natrinema salsiterrestre]
MNRIDHPGTGSSDLVESAESLTVDDGTYRLAYDPSVDDTSLAVVDLVATITHTDAVDLEPLHSAIDTTALDRLSSGTDGGNHVDFRYAGYQITVDTAGLITCSRSPGEEKRTE